MESAEFAAKLLHKAILDEGCLLDPPVLHADNGGPQKGFTMKAKLEDLGVTPSYSRPRGSNDNPYSESLFRTFKYRPEYPVEGFASIEAARKWVRKFVWWYNEGHLHSAIRFVTPSQRHRGEDATLLAIAIGFITWQNKNSPIGGAARAATGNRSKKCGSTVQKIAKPR